MLVQIAERIRSGYNTKLGAFLSWVYIISLSGVAYGTDYTNVDDIKNLSVVFATSPLMLYGLDGLGVYKEYKKRQKENRPVTHINGS